MSDKFIASQQPQVDEQRLKTAIEQLHCEIAERRRLEEALDVSNTEFRNFLHMVSHDLREPLRKISSFGMLLKNSIEGRLDKEDQENLGFMIDGADRMTKMIEDLVAYSRMNIKTITREIVDINEFIEQLQQLELAALLEDTGTIIEISKPLPKVCADPALLRQLLQNLIVNRITNCRDNTDNIQPRILIRAESAKENMVRIELQDNGVCVDKQPDNDIFKMLINLRPNQEQEAIGLAVCKKIIDKHGGQIGVESKEGTGSTYWFTLPVSNS